MSTQQNYLLAPSVLANDRMALNALSSIDDYAPRNPAYGTVALRELELTLRQAELEAEQARLALDAARARLIEASWAFHSGVLGAKAEVVVQFGADSQRVHAMGLKRKSERKRPIRRRPTAD